MDRILPRLFIILFSYIGPPRVEFVMSDASLLLPPTVTPLTGIDFTKRLPCGEVERARRSIRTFFRFRQLSLDLQIRVETRYVLGLMDYVTVFSFLALGKFPSNCNYCEFYKCDTSNEMLEKMIFHKIHICNICGLHELCGCVSSNFVLEKMICHKIHICNLYGLHEHCGCGSSSFVFQ